MKIKLLIHALTTAFETLTLLYDDFDLVVDAWTCIEVSELVSLQCDLLSTLRNSLKSG